MNESLMLVTALNPHIGKFGGQCHFENSIEKLKEKKLQKLKKKNLCACVCLYRISMSLSSHGMHVEVREELAGVGSVLVVLWDGSQQQSRRRARHRSPCFLLRAQVLGVVADAWRRRAVRPCVGNVTRWHCLVTNSRRIHLFLPFLDSM